MKINAKTLRAVLFDMDGVIVDSMPYHFMSWYEALRPYGVQVTCIEIYRREGEKWDKTMAELCGAAGLKLTKKLRDKIFYEKCVIFNKYFKRFMFNGVDGTLACLKQDGLKLGLVTGTFALEAQRILPKETARSFDVLLTGDQVKHGKPDPEPYLTAAKNLGLKPSQCLVIENAPLGIRAAKAARMFCVGITTSLPKEYLKGADVVVNTLDEARKFVCKNVINDRKYNNNR